MGSTRNEALKLAHKAAQTITSAPVQAAQSAEQAFQILTKLEGSSAEDRAACAGLAARAWRKQEEPEKAKHWFKAALKLSSSPSLQAELADLLMREGEIDQALKALGNTPKTPHAQWHQTAAKIHLTCGLPERAAQEITLALSAPVRDDFANLAALHIDAAGIDLRRGRSPEFHLEKAQNYLKQAPSAHPEIQSAMISVAAQAPDLSPEERLLILQGMDLTTLAPQAALTFSITLAEAAARAHRPELVSETLKNLVLPENHPLFARALFLKNDPRASDVALTWLKQAPTDDPDLLLGLQRTVDPISPLIGSSPETLAETALIAQNFALRKKLGGSPLRPANQTVFYLIYEKNFRQHYGALVFSSSIHWVPLGPAKKIHQRIARTVDAAERTLAETHLGTTLSARLTLLWKSVWQPLTQYLDPTKPLHIAPAGMLHNVPWATLRNREGRFLCQHFQSAQVLALTGNFSPQNSKPERLITGTSVKTSGRPALPGVIKELKTLTKKPLLNPSKKDLLLSLQKSPGLIHLAGHGFVEDGGNFDAGLALKDGTLFAKEIVQLDLSETGLVVLSACRGGVGASEVGGNWSSLRRSFVAAGARQVMAAQWRVTDRDLPGFMKLFYEILKTHPAPTALWKSQAAWLADEKFGPKEIRTATAGAWVMEGF